MSKLEMGNLTFVTSHGVKEIIPTALCITAPCITAPQAAEHFAWMNASL